MSGSRYSSEQQSRSMKESLIRKKSDSFLNKYQKLTLSIVWVSHQTEVTVVGCTSVLIWV